jgi:hypothetical protein
MLQPKQKVGFASSRFRNPVDELDSAGSCIDVRVQERLVLAPDATPGRPTGSLGQPAPRGQKGDSLLWVSWTS